MDCLEEKLIGAASVALQGSWRIASDPQRVPRHDRPDHVRSARQSIGRCPGSAPALIAGTKRPGEPGIGGDQVAGCPGALSGKSDESIEDGEIMLGVVNGLGGIRRCGPAEPGSGCGFRSSCKLGKVGEPALSGPDGPPKRKRTVRVAGPDRDRDADKRSRSVVRPRRSQVPRRDAPLRAGLR